MVCVIGNFSLYVEYYLNGQRVSNISSMTINGAPYVALPHGVEFKIILKSTHNTPSDVELLIDGECMGKWRLDANSSISLERPVHSARNFTYLRETSTEAIDAGIESGKANNGLIKAIFKPEKVIHKSVPFVSPYGNFIPYIRKSPINGSEFLQTDSIVRSGGGGSDSRGSTYKTPSPSSVSDSIVGIAPRTTVSAYTSGATALGTASRQQFSQTAAIRNYDFALQTEINIRLVVDEVLSSALKDNTVYGVVKSVSERASAYANLVPPRLPY